ncbi:unnamed protein product, partial [Ectocarpus fasciculatus]
RDRRRIGQTSVGGSVEGVGSRKHLGKANRDGIVSINSPFFTLSLSRTHTPVFSLSIPHRFSPSLPSHSLCVP